MLISFVLDAFTKELETDESEEKEKEDAWVPHMVHSRSHHQASTMLLDASQLTGTKTGVQGATPWLHPLMLA